MVVAFNTNKFLDVVYDNKEGIRVELHDGLIDLMKEVEEAYKNGEIKESDYKKIVKEIDETIKLLYKPGTTVVQVHDRIITLSKLIEEATEGKVVPVYEYESKLDEISDPTTRAEVKKRTLRAYESFLWFVADPTQENWKAFQSVWGEVPSEYRDAARSEINERTRAMLVGDWETACKGMGKNKSLVIKHALEPHTDLLKEIFSKGDFYDKGEMLADAYAGTQMLISEFSSAKEIDEYESAWKKIERVGGERRAAYNLAVRYTYGLYTHTDETTGSRITAEDMLKSMWTGAKGKDGLEILHDIGRQIINDRGFRQKKRDFINEYGEDTLLKMDLMGQYSFLTWTLPAIEAAGRATFYSQSINDYYNQPEQVDPDQFTKEMIEKCGDVAMATGYAGQAGLFARGIPRILGYYNEYNTIMSILETIEVTADGIQSHYAPISSRVMKHYCEVQVPAALDAALGAFLGRAEQYLLKDPSEALGAITPGRERIPWGKRFEMEDPVTKWERMLQMRAGANITPLDIRLPQNFSLFEGETYLYLTPDDVRARVGVDIKSVREIYRDVFSLASLRMLPERNYWAVRPPPGSYFDLIARLARVEWERLLLGTEFTTLRGQSAADGLVEWAGITTGTGRGTASVGLFGPRSMVELIGAAGEAALENPVDERGQVNDAYMAKIVAKDLGSEDWNIDNFNVVYTKSDVTYYTPEGKESEVLNEDVRAMLDLYHRQTNSDTVMFAEKNTINGYYNVYVYHLRPPMKEGEEPVWVRAGVFRLSEEQAVNWFAGYTTTSKDIRMMLTEGKGMTGFILGLQTDLLAKGIGGAVIYDKEGKINLGTVMDIVLESSTTGNLNNGVVYLATFWDTRGNLSKITMERFMGAGAAYEWESEEDTDMGKFIERGWVLGGIGRGTADLVASFGWQKRNVGVDAAWLHRTDEKGRKRGRAGWGGYFENSEFYSFIMSNFLYSLTGTEGAVGAIEFKDETFLGKPRLQVSWFHANRELKHYQFQAARNAFLQKMKEQNDILEEIDEYRKKLQKPIQSVIEYKELEAKLRDAEKRLLIVQKEAERWRNIANRLFLAAAGEQYWTAQFIGGGFGLEAALGASKDYLAMLANTFIEFDRTGASANFGYRTDVRLKTGGGKIIMPLGDALATIQGGAWTSLDGKGNAVFGGIISNPYSEKGAGVVAGRKGEWITSSRMLPGRTDVTTYESGVFGWWGGPLEGMAKGTRQEVYVLMKYENGVFTPYRIDLTGEEWKKWKLEPGWTMMRIDPLTGKQIIYGFAGLFGAGKIKSGEEIRSTEEPFLTELEEHEFGGAFRVELVNRGSKQYGEISAVYQTLKPKGAPESQRYGIVWFGGNLGIVIPID
ncbi:MAG: DUF4200 domain-containing protein [Candidatus Anstonellales archaeon]